MMRELTSVVRAFAGHDPYSHYVVQELGVAARAFQYAEEAAAADNSFGVWTYCRTITETAIRLAWLAESHGGKREETERRIQRLAKRDMLNLLAADDAIRAVADQSVVMDRAELDRSISSNLEDPAPSQMRQLATEAGWEWVYGLHRLASTIIHPGSVAFDGHRSIPTEDTLDSLHFSMAATVIGGAAVLTKIAPDVTFPEPVECARTLKAIAG